MDSRWLNYYFDLAARNAVMSYDPSTQVGAVIARPDKTVASMGYNNFPRGVDDDPKLYADRETKIRRVVHAEMNALLTAREPLHGYTLFVRPLPPCPHCAGAIIQAGIKKIVWSGADVPERWAEDMAEAERMFAGAGVVVERADNIATSVSPETTQTLLNMICEKDATITRQKDYLQGQIEISTELRNKLDDARMYDYRNMPSIVFNEASFRVFGDHASISAARSLVTAAEDLTKRVSELQKRRDELQTANSELHDRVCKLRHRLDVLDGSR